MSFKGKGRKILLGLISVVMILTYIGFRVEAENESGILYEQIENVATTYRQKPYTYKPKTGYVFAGWYRDDHGADPLTEQEANEADEAYAKYVPVEVLSVKAQVNETALKDKITDTDRAAIRILTSVDSTKYDEVGFRVHRSDTNYTYNLASKQVFSQVRVVGSVNGDYVEDYKPETVFCNDSHYFEAVTFYNMPSSAVDTELTATPYWKTMDGTEVVGATSIKTVNLGRSWIYVDSTSTNNDELGTLSAPYKTIANAVGHDTTLEPKIFLNSDTTIGSKISISKDVTLTTKVENGVTVKRTGNVNMFEVGSDAKTGDVTFEISGKVTLDGNKTDYANATHMVINRGILILGKDTVIQNASRSGDAAAIYSNEALVIDGTVKNCDNTNANNCGAIKVVKGSLSGSGTFKNNTSSGNAGVIYMQSGTTATLTNATFSNNQSAKNGGAIYNEGSVTATSCTFNENNSTGSNGGAICNSSSASKLDISESTFTNNYCSAANMSGGAINCASTQGITINVTNTTFSNNHTTNAGGAIMVSNNADTASTLNLSNCKYEGNYTTSGDGGAIYTYGKITGTSCEFSDNHANNKGGAIALRRTTSSLTLQMDEDEMRGAISSNYSNTGHGGAIFVHSDVVGTISITGYDFTNNTAGQSTTNKVNGGAIWNESSKDKVVIYDSTFTSNTTTNVGGAIGSNASFTVDKCIFKENQATNDASCKDIYVPSGISSGTENISADEAEDLRVIFSSDVHYTDQLEYWNLTKEQRMEYWKKCILAENAKDPIDLLVINGDISLDYWEGQDGNGDGAFFEEPSAPTTQEFVTNYVQPLRDAGIPVVVMPGNHEHYDNTAWLEMTGNNRQGYMVLKNNLFLFMDNYVESDPESDDDGVCTATDVSYIKEIMNQYPLCDVYIVSHYFDWQGVEANNSEFKQLVAENSRIKGLIHGHTHNSEVWKLGAEGGYKTIINTGHFSGSSDQTYNAYWGFSELIVSPESAYSQFIKIPKDINAEPANQTFERINKVLYTQKVNTYDKLVSTINDATYACTIEIPQSFEMSDGITMSGNNFTLISKAMDGITLTRTTGASMFTVESGSRFKISGKITLDGNKDFVTEDMHGIINQGIFTLGGYAAIQNAERSAGNGGAIWNSGTLRIDGTLRNNSVTDNDAKTAGKGGAIYMSAGTISGSGIFIGNSAKNGAAIFIETGKTATLTNAVLQKNVSTSDGGAIYNHGSLTLTNCTVGGENLGNYTSGGNGGAIYNSENATKLDVTGSSFTGNYCSASGKNGGAIDCLSTKSITINVTDTTFSDNHTTNAGGAIGVLRNANTASTLNLTNCDFKNNYTTTGNGGAIFTYGKVTGVSCLFDGNYAVGTGGAISLSSATSGLTLKMNEEGTRGTFSSNYSTKNSGGAIFVQNAVTGNISISGYDFVGNEAGKSVTDKRNGGAICIDGTSTGTVSFVSCTFDANKTNNAGGAIRCADTLTVENCKFRNNVATNEGGAIHGGQATIQGKYYFEGNTGGTNYNGIHKDNATFATGATAYESWDAE